MNTNTRRQPSDPQVLIVDCDGARLAQDRRRLTLAGYSVVTARSGMHAQRLLEQKPVALVMTEQVMPGMDGLALLRFVKSRWPKTRAVIMTERPRGQLVMQAKLEANARTLIRPVSDVKLMTVVKEELDAYGE
jgi:DNA-binding NtrC family response regulator